MDIRNDAKNSKDRLVYIPMNEGEHHWATLVLHVRAQRICSAIYVNSMPGDSKVKRVLASMSNKKSEKRATDSLLEIRERFNLASKYMTKDVCRVLPEDSFIASSLRAADSLFKHRVEERYQDIQTDGTSCGAFSIENAIECIIAVFEWDVQLSKKGQLHFKWLGD